MPERRRNRKNFVQIGEVVDKVLRQYRPISDQALLQVWELWEEAVGEAIAANARPAAFKGDTLLVHVSSSTWLHHMRFLESDLISKINNALGDGTIRSIKLKVGTV